MSSEQDKLTRRRIAFVRDASLRLAELGACLLALERDPADEAARQRALAALHTLKGNAGLVGLETLGTLAHGLEEVLLGAAQGALDAELRRGLDALSAMVAVIAETLDQPVPPIPLLETILAARPERITLLARSGPGAVTAQPSHPAQVSASVEHLDDLFELVEELLANHGQLARSPAEARELVLAHQRRLLRELRVMVLRTRLLPLDRAFGGLERLVHDLAERLNWRTRLVVDGADIEVDRSVLEPVRELVVHLVHNALAHGLEPPEERLAAGKPEAGTIQLLARPEQSGTVLEVIDDGRGLERQEVIARAVALGLCTEDQAAGLDDAQVWAFLAHPGFTTRARADRIAGRGVGLSAVRQGVEALRGRLEIASEPGKGTTVRLWLPSVLALDEVVLVRVGTERYAIPQASVTRVSSVREAAGVPALDLRERLGVRGGSALGERLLIVCRRIGGAVGLLVDGVVGRDEQVIQPLPRRARQPGLLGAIVTEDGQVALVLDLDGL